MPPRLTVSSCLCALALLSIQQGPAQQSDGDEIKRRFLKAREETVQPSKPRQPAPAASSTSPSGSAPSSKKKAKPKPKPKPNPVPKQQPKPQPKPSPSSDSPPTSKPASENPPAVVPASPVKPAPAATESKPAPNAPPKVVPKTEDIPVVIEKSGVDPRTGFQAPSFFGWFSRKSWKYLSTSLRNEIDQAPVQKARWRYIVVHNSGTRQGNAKSFDYYHTKVRKMSNGLAYHFVIGNGTSSGDGAIEVGNRWRKQINGGHVHSDYLNNIALGICLVGDFNQERPTPKQLEALDELIRYLRQRTGKNDGKWAVVKAHREINPPRWPTDCPGNDFPYTWLHSRFD